MNTQISLPVEVQHSEVARERHLGGAIDLCIKASGYEADKQLQSDLGVDKGQFSRWRTDQEGIIWAKLEKLMDLCGNDAPLLWMLHQRGYDLSSLRKRESETERQLRLAKEEIVALRRVMMEGK